MMKLIRQQIGKYVRPRTVIPLRLDGETLDPSIGSQVGTYFGLWFLFALTSTLFVCSFGVDVVSAGTSVLATLNNAGPGLGMVGPASNFGALPVLVKLWLSVCMLAGRLEFYAILSLLVPGFWRQ